jgi:hypothetical protein
MADETQPLTEIVIYRTEDGRTRIQCRFADGMIWLTQAMMAELFQTTPQNVTLHLKAIFREGELDEESTCKDYLQVQDLGPQYATFLGTPGILSADRFREFPWRRSPSFPVLAGAFGSTPLGLAPGHLHSPGFARGY